MIDTRIGYRFKIKTVLIPELCQERKVCGQTVVSRRCAEAACSAFATDGDGIYKAINAQSIARALVTWQ